ncbi:MAG: DUF4249 domain-containing protein [Bacteroidota bacterium]
MRPISLLSILFFAGLILSCVEKIDFENDSFESALVISATMTNETKQQEISISRTFRFEDDGPSPVLNAAVTVIGDGIPYNFQDTGNGRYLSEEVFAAQPNIDYHLEIVTEGEKYISSVTQLTQPTEIDELYAERETNDDAVNGMSIYVDSFDPTGNAQFFRYEFEETFKVIAPDWVDQDAIVIEDDPFCIVGLVPRPEEQKVCYRTEESIDFILASTNDLNESRIVRQLVRFIPSDDYRLSHRYSILARQFVISEDVHNYLETIRNFSSEGSLFSQIQPGFIAGNIRSERNPDEKVIGFFEVSSVSSRRIFFNYEEFYPNELLPPYISDCQRSIPDRFTEHMMKTEVCGPLIRRIRTRVVVFLDTTGNDFAPFIMVPRVCGDCTAIGKPEVPEFWIE